ncbi:hypothetical protein C8R45DRAFT_992362 [Mycena sanguinolenta]|nr:hypothetical protein C8R45DRAFT_992362 [Mycena sanguinolenta]
MISLSSRVLTKMTRPANQIRPFRLNPRNRKPSLRKKSPHLPLLAAGALRRSRWRRRSRPNFLLTHSPQMEPPKMGDCRSLSKPPGIRFSSLPPTVLCTSRGIQWCSEQREKPQRPRPSAWPLCKAFGFWRVAAPENSPQDPQAKGYIKPDDYLQSPFIIQVLSRILKKEEFILPTEVDPVSKKYDFSDMPSGLLAMSAAAIERALKLYIDTGVRPERLPKFSKVSSGTSVTSYLKNIRRFTLTRWEGILAACGAQTVASAPPVPFAFDAYRDFIYTPSSP